MVDGLAFGVAGRSSWFSQLAQWFLVHLQTLTPQSCGPPVTDRGWPHPCVGVAAVVWTPKDLGRGCSWARIVPNRKQSLSQTLHAISYLPTFGEVDLGSMYGSIASPRQGFHRVSYGSTDRASGRRADGRSPVQRRLGAPNTKTLDGAFGMFLLGVSSDVIVSPDRAALTCDPRCHTRLTA